MKMKRRKMATYGPQLTDRQEANLRKEIASFNKEKTLREIEKGSVGGTQIDTSEFEDLDSLNSEQVLSFKAPPLDKEVEMAKIEIDEILSLKEKKAWKLCMRDGYSQEEAALKMNVSRASLQVFIERATKKIQSHFQRGEL